MTLGYEVNVPDDLKPLLIPVESVTRHPKNVRKGKPDIIALSVKRFGQLKPIVVQQATPEGEVRNLIVAGNHLHEAIADRLKWPQIAATFKIMSDDDAYQYLLADNRASDLAEYDRMALAAGLGELAERGLLTDSLWAADDLDDLVAEVRPLETMVQEFTGDYSDDPEKRKQRSERELTRVATKMREVPVVITVEQHAIFMADIKVLQKAWHTGGAIETILLAVHKAAESIDGVAQSVERKPEVLEVAGSIPAPITTPEAPATDAPQASETPPADPVGTPAMFGPSEGLAAPPAAPEPLLPAAAAADVWRQVSAKVVRAVQNLGMTEIKTSVMIGLLEGVQPMPSPDAPVAVREARRVVTAIRDSIIMTETPSMRLGELLSLIGRVQVAQEAVQ